MANVTVPKSAKLCQPKPRTMANIMVPKSAKLCQPKPHNTLWTVSKHSKPRSLANVQRIIVRHSTGTWKPKKTHLHTHPLDTMVDVARNIFRRAHVLL